MLDALHVLLLHLMMMLLSLMVLLCLSNHRADMSAPGIERSFGIMVNYKYIVQDVNSNNRAYLVEHKVAASPEIQAMADAT